MPYSLPDLLEAVRRFTLDNLPGFIPTAIDITLHGRPDPLHIPIPLLPYYPSAPARAPEDAAPVEDEKPSAKKPMIHPCIKEILATLRAAGRPLTKTRLLEEMERQGHEWSESTVTRYLEVLLKDGVVENPPDARPRGYRVAE